MGLANQISIGIVARIRIEQAFLIRENQQPVRLYQIRHQRRQGIVIPKTDFVGDHGIVLIHHRHHTKPQQGQQGRASIEIALAIRQIVVGEQHLGGMQLMLLKAGLPGLHQPHLPHRSGGLQFMHGIRTHRPAQPGHPLCHRPG